MDLSKLSDNSFLGNSPSNYLIGGRIQEVEENFEASGNNFGTQLSLNGAYDPPDSIDDWNGNLVPGSLPNLEHRGYKKNMTPQKLPAIKAPLLQRNMGLDYMSMDRTNSQNRLNRNSRRVSEPKNELNQMWIKKRSMVPQPSAKSQYNNKLDTYNQQL